MGQTHAQAEFVTFAGLDFRYTDPERGWDSRRVKGVVARLARVHDPTAATALEVAAGGKLWQVVVDSEASAKALLARGQLRSRVTLIPLNQVCWPSGLSWSFCGYDWTMHENGSLCSHKDAQIT